MLSVALRCAHFKCKSLLKVKVDILTPLDVLTLPDTFSHGHNLEYEWSCLNLSTDGTSTSRNADIRDCANRSTAQVFYGILSKLTMLWGSGIESN